MSDDIVVVVWHVADIIGHCGVITFSCRVFPAMCVHAGFNIPGLGGREKSLCRADERVTPRRLLRNNVPHPPDVW